MRNPWPKHFPSIFALTPWRDGQVELAADPRYFPAKQRRDAEAAYSLCQHYGSDSSVVDNLCDFVIESMPGNVPIVAAPSLNLADNGNALAIGFAKWLAAEMGWVSRQEIFQSKKVGRDFVVDGWFRLVNQPEFYGNVDTGRPYVLADDMFHMGGTLAALRGFIEHKGGTVIGMCTVGYGSYGRMIALANETRFGLTAGYGGALEALLRKELGYGIDCLTEPEGRFLLGCSSIDEIREGINGARNA